MTHRQQAVPAPPVLSNPDPTPDSLGIAGARRGLADNATTGRFIGQDRTLKVVSVPPGDDVARAARAALERTPFIVLDAPRRRHWRQRTCPGPQARFCSTRPRPKARCATTAAARICCTPFPRVHAGRPADAIPADTPLGGHRADRGHHARRHRAPPSMHAPPRNSASRSARARPGPSMRTCAATPARRCRSSPKTWAITPSFWWPTKPTTSPAASPSTCGRAPSPETGWWSNGAPPSFSRVSKRMPAAPCSMRITAPGPCCALWAKPSPAPASTTRPPCAPACSARISRWPAPRAAR